MNAICGLENIKIIFVFVQLSFSNFLWSKLFMSFLVWPAWAWVQPLEKCGYRPWCLLVKNTWDYYKYTDPASGHSQGYYPDVPLPCLEDIVLRLQTILSFSNCTGDVRKRKKEMKSPRLILASHNLQFKTSRGTITLVGSRRWARTRNVEEEAEAQEETMKLNVCTGETIGENVKGFGKGESEPILVQVTTCETRPLFTLLSEIY